MRKRSKGAPSPKARASGTPRSDAGVAGNVRGGFSGQGPGLEHVLLRLVNRHGERALFKVGKKQVPQFISVNEK